MTSNSGVHSIREEKAYLSDIITCPGHIYLAVVHEECFQDTRHQAIFLAAHAIAARGGALGTTSVVTELEKTGKMLNAGGQDYVWEVVQAAYVEPIELLAQRLERGRRATQLRTAIAKATLMTDSGQYELAVGLLEAGLADYASQASSKPITAAQLMGKAFDSMAKRKSFVSTGIRSVDERIGGITPGSLTIIGADTSVGKTSLALSMFLRQSRAGVVPGFVSCEDDDGVLGPRLLALVANIDTQKIRTGNASRDDFLKSAKAIESESKNQARFVFSIGGNEHEICAAVRDLAQSGCKCVIVDYVQAISAKYASREDTRKEMIRRIASNLKAQASKFKIPLILLSQIARQQDEAAEPSKHALKECGDLENMAEVVLMLWRKSIEHNSIDYQKLSLRIAKSKYGGDGHVVNFERNNLGHIVET